ncbi:hypothetical protein J3F84DRAFT_18385 [Trichoderma pleuroticola]
MHVIRLACLIVSLCGGKKAKRSRVGEVDNDFSWFGQAFGHHSVTVRRSSCTPFLASGGCGRDEIDEHQKVRQAVMLRNPSQSGYHDVSTDWRTMAKQSCPYGYELMATVSSRWSTRSNSVMLGTCI